VIAAQQAMRDWVNGKTDLVGEGNPLALGAFLRMQRSPADGAYAVLARNAGAPGAVAEPSPDLCTAGIVFQVYSPSETTAEAAAAALMSEIETLTGSPQACGDSDVWALVHDQATGPVALPQPADGGEPYCFQLSAQFTLAIL
jgi:hypothetical protein